ncbi:DUF5949 family protein [Streptomyces sp. NPDC085946]|uniref:DUF5949 family protein n=1 Tax=Streptomyces sp. NPDC085946 TaxID=3365744 RepID=UPI0037D32A71
MTSAPTAPAGTQPFSTADLGTFLLMSWLRENPQGDVPCLLACCLGNGAGGPAGSSAAVGQLLRSAGLAVGGDIVDGTRRPGTAMSLLVVPGSAMLTMPRFTTQFVPPAGWLETVAARGFAYLLMTTRPWPDAEPGDPGTLVSFVADEETRKAAAQVLLPARSLRT